MYKPTDMGITSDQSLALHGKIIEYVREALVYDKGYVVFEVKDIERFEFDFYHSDGSNINVVYEETREETVDRIMYTIDCAEFNKGKEQNINEIIKHLYNYIIGYVSINTLYQDHGIKDHSDIFRNSDNLE